MRILLHKIWKIITTPFRFLIWLVIAPFRFLWRSSQKLSAFFNEDVEDTPLPDAFAKTIENPIGVIEHLDALRQHLLRSVVYLLITTAISFTFITPILEFLTKPLTGGLDSLQAIDVTEGVGTVMRVSLLSGFALAFPLIAFELWLFAAPGLKPNGRIFSLFSIPIAALFFVGGMAFAYFFMLPTALPLLLNFMGISTIPRPNSYFPFVTNLLFWLGISFEFPLVIFILARLGMVTAHSLAGQWRLAIVVISVLAAAITTTTDPANMALVMVPMSVLYFISIGLAFVAERRKLS